MSAMSDDTLAMFVVYRYPRDYPDKYVVRRHVVTSTGSRPDMEPLSVTDSLDAARQSLPVGLYNIGRYGRRMSRR